MNLLEYLSEQSGRINRNMEAQMRYLDDETQQVCIEGEQKNISEEADVFRLYGKLVEPMKKFEETCRIHEAQKKDVTNAKDTIHTCFITPFVYAALITVALAIPFVIIFWIVVNVVQVEGGIKLVDLYYPWYESFAIRDIVVNWSMGIEGLFLQFLSLIVVAIFEFVLMPIALILVLPAFGLGIIGTILGVIHASMVIAKAKIELPVREQQIEKMLEQLTEPLTYVPPSYRYSEAIEYFYNSFCNKRADELKEAVNLYDTYVHRRSLEESQQVMIQNQVEMLKKIDYQTVQLKKMNSKLKDIEHAIWWDAVL